MTRSRLSVMVSAALITAMSLVGGVLLGVAGGEYVFNTLPGHNTGAPAPAHILLAVVPALSGMLAGAALWGLWLGRLAGASGRRRQAVAGAVGFAPMTIALGIGLAVLEPVAAAKLGTAVPIYRLFTLFFVPAAFLIAGVGAWALGLALRDRAFAWGLAWRASLAAALAFLVLNLAMDGLGWRIGAPGAASRLTMLTVMFVSNVGAALAAGAAIGHRLGGLAQAHVPRKV